ncbi:MAG TPA: hypothetical protein VG826_09235 [Pirellulales bacterium]|nr:hypothetical protein [Pirellulales bacterium]
MEENPYKAPGQMWQPNKAVAYRLSPIVGFACCAVVATCAFIMLSRLNQILDLSAYIFIGLNGATWIASAVAAFANRRRAFYTSLLLDALVFFSGVIFASANG